MKKRGGDFKVKEKATGPAKCIYTSFNIIKKLPGREAALIKYH
jgi:hypothetical protein